MALVGFKLVTVKLLPFDNKSELQVVVDLPRGTSLEETDRVLADIADRIGNLKELASIQAYTGTAAPFNFNGLVRHAHLRSDAEQGDLQINLLPKHDRGRSSHDIALEVRKRIAGLAVPERTVIKVAEVPPGPPVMATLLAEIYGPDAETRRAVAREVRTLFRSVPFIVDDDDSFGVQAPRKRIALNQDNLEYYKVDERDVYDTLQVLLGGIPPLSAEHDRVMICGNPEMLVALKAGLISHGFTGADRRRERCNAMTEDSERTDGEGNIGRVRDGPSSAANAIWLGVPEMLCCQLYGTTISIRSSPTKTSPEKCCRTSDVSSAA
jgi:hypothetical protein